MKKSNDETHFLGSGEVIKVTVPEGGWGLLEDTITMVSNGQSVPWCRGERCVAIWPGKMPRQFWAAFLSLDSNNRPPRGMQRKARKGGRHG